MKFNKKKNNKKNLTQREGDRKRPLKRNAIKNENPKMLLMFKTLVTKVFIKTTEKKKTPEIFACA